MQQPFAQPQETVSRQSFALPPDSANDYAANAASVCAVSLRNLSPGAAGHAALVLLGVPNVPCSHRRPSHSPCGPRRSDCLPRILRRTCTGGCVIVTVRMPHEARQSAVTHDCILVPVRARRGVTWRVDIRHPRSLLGRFWQMHGSGLGSDRPVNSGPVTSSRVVGQGHKVGRPATDSEAGGPEGSGMRRLA